MFIWNETCMSQVWEKLHIQNPKQCRALSLPAFSQVSLYRTSSTCCLWLLVSNSVSWCCCIQLPTEDKLVLIPTPHTPPHSLHPLTARCGIIDLHHSTCPQLSFTLMNWILITQAHPTQGCKILAHAALVLTIKLLEIQSS